MGKKLEYGKTLHYEVSLCLYATNFEYENWDKKIITTNSFVY